MNAGSYFRGGLSLTCPLPVGKERLPGYGTSVPKVLAPLHPPISMPPLLIGTREPWKGVKLCLFGNRLGRHFRKVPQPLFWRDP